MKRAIAKEWLWFISALAIGLVVSPILIYGLSTHRYEEYFLIPRDHTQLESVVDSSSGMVASDSTVARFNCQNVYSSLSEIHSVETLGTFDDFCRRMRSASNRQYAMQVISTELRERILVQKRRIDESGYKLFFAHATQPSHYLLLLAPYLICVFWRFTYWSIRTALSAFRHRN